jgi:sterol desaturase/sphingolipid hydroxylase (fatty acid hydroxylase superfamily)
MNKQKLQYIVKPTTSNKISENVWLTVEMNIMMNYVMKFICFKHKMVNNHLITAEPTIIESVVYLLFFEEVLFHNFHYLMHTRYFKWIHKWHHEIIYPEPQHSIYCSPIEHFVVNMMPILIPGSILNVNPWILLIWEVIAAINTMNGHSNKHLRLLPTGDKHLLHHTLSNVNYGVLSIIDNLTGTVKTISPVKSND